MTANDLAEERAASRRYNSPCHRYECCCARCLGEGPDDDRDESDVSPLARRMEAAGYDADGHGGWRLTGRIVWRVARRDHKDGRIKAGQRYGEMVTYRVDEYGGGSRRTHRWPVVAS
jgi:hypothetical protein